MDPKQIINSKNISLAKQNQDEKNKNQINLQSIRQEAVRNFSKHTVVLQKPSQPTVPLKQGLGSETIYFGSGSYLEGHFGSGSGSCPRVFSDPDLTTGFFGSGSGSGSLFVKFS